MIQFPSQYDCDNMEIGDVVFVKPTGIIYNFIRKHFKKDLIKIKIRDGWEEPIVYKEYYQEDCTLIHSYELECVQKFENQVPCTYSKDVGSKIRKTSFLPLLQVGLYNIQLKLNRNLTITIPTSFIHKALEENQKLLKSYDDKRKVQDAIRFQKFKGNYFRDYVHKNDIVEWVPVYCSVCGKPVVFKFSDDIINIDNKCECNSLNFPLSEISYDEFALWYANQIVTPSIINRYNSFWFRRDDKVEK